MKTITTVRYAPIPHWMGPGYPKEWGPYLEGLGQADFESLTGRRMLEAGHATAFFKDVSGGPGVWEDWPQRTVTEGMADEVFTYFTGDPDYGLIPVFYHQWETLSDRRFGGETNPSKWTEVGRYADWSGRGLFNKNEVGAMESRRDQLEDEGYRWHIRTNAVWGGSDHYLYKSTVRGVPPKGPGWYAMSPGRDAAELNPDLHDPIHTTTPSGIPAGATYNEGDIFTIQQLKDAGVTQIHFISSTGTRGAQSLADRSEPIENYLSSPGYGPEAFAQYHDDFSPPGFYNMVQWTRKPPDEASTIQDANGRRWFDHHLFQTLQRQIIENLEKGGDPSAGRWQRGAGPTPFLSQAEAWKEHYEAQGLEARIITGKAVDLVGGRPDYTIEYRVLLGHAPWTEISTYPSPGPIESLTAPAQAWADTVGPWTEGKEVLTTSVPWATDLVKSTPGKSFAFERDVPEAPKQEAEPLPWEEGYQWPWEDENLGVLGQGRHQGLQVTRLQYEQMG